jgi:hypothetical protein
MLFFFSMLLVEEVYGESSMRLSEYGLAAEKQRPLAWGARFCASPPRHHHHPTYCTAGRREKGPLAGIPDKAAEAAAKPRLAAKQQVVLRSRTGEGRESHPVSVSFFISPRGPFFSGCSRRAPWWPRACLGIRTAAPRALDGRCPP